MTFGIKSLTEVRGEPFVLEDETIIYFRRRTGLTKEESDQIMLLSAEAEKIDFGAEDANRNKEIIEKAYDMMYKMIPIILPDLPDEVMKKLSLTQLTAILTYWRNTEEEAEKKELKGSKKVQT